MGSPLVVELADIGVADVENTALTTYTDPPNTYRHFVDDEIGDFRDKSHADGFLNFLKFLTDDLQYTIEYPSNDGCLHTWASSSTLTNPRLSTENLHTPTFMSATIPVPLHPPRTVSSDPLQDEPTSYAPPTLTKRTGHSLHNLLTTKHYLHTALITSLNLILQEAASKNSIISGEFLPSSPFAQSFEHHRKDWLSLRVY